MYNGYMENTNKEINLVILVVVGAIAVAFIAFWFGRNGNNNMFKNAADGNQQTATPTVTSTQQVTAVVTASATPLIDDSVLLRAAVLTKSGIPAAKFEFSLGEIQGNVARGSVRNSDDMGGAAWFAGKTEAVWTISYIGQGVPMCADLGTFAYPTTWLSHCVNGSGETIAR